MKTTAPLLIFLAILTPLMVAYSLNIPVASVDPVPVKPEMVYNLGKNNVIIPDDRNEVRQVDLTLSGSTVTGATVQFYKRTTGIYSVRTTVKLYDANGNSLSSGTVCATFTGTGTRTASVTFSPAVSIESVYRVEAVILRVAAC